VVLLGLLPIRAIIIAYSLSPLGSCPIGRQINCVPAASSLWRWFP